MITPRFHLSQDDNFLFVTIHAPFSRVSDAEVFMDGTDFRFHSKPYFLRLNLPGEIVENDEAKADFDTDKNEFKIKCPKVAKGFHFKGLDMLTSLLEPKGKRNVEDKSAGIQVLSDSVESTAEESETDFDWFIEQKLEPETELVAGSVGYGFAERHSGVFSKIAEELHQVVDVKDPDSKSLIERRNARLEQEEKEFNPEHYLADHFQTDYIEPLIDYKLPIPSADWTESETNLLKNLPNKDFLLDPNLMQSTYLSLVDILLAYSYDRRTTMSEPTVESAWTIGKISGTLSWLEVFTSIKQVAICFLRRSLSFPLYRNFQLSLKAIEDTKSILSRGRSGVLKCFLQINQLFNKSEPRYLLNQLYINDFCVWIQKCSDETLASLADGLGNMILRKEDLDLNLDDLERAAANLMSYNDSSSEDDEVLEDQLARLAINKTQPDVGSYPMDLLVAARAAAEVSSSSSSSSSSELDSDDDSSSSSD